MQAVEKALEVEADMLEDPENKASETLRFKRLQYKGPPNWRAHSYKNDRNMGTSEEHKSESGAGI